MSTTIVKAIGNLDLTSNMKERRRYSNGPSHSGDHAGVNHNLAENPVNDSSPHVAQQQPGFQQDRQPVYAHAEERQQPRDANMERLQRRRPHRDPRAFYADSAQMRERNTDRDYHDRRRESEQVAREAQRSRGRMNSHYSDSTRNVGSRAVPAHADQQPVLRQGMEQPYRRSYDEQQPPSMPYQREMEMDQRVNQPQPGLDTSARGTEARRQQQPRVQNRVAPANRPANSSNGKRLRLPINRMRAKGMITLDQPRSMLAEQYRAIRMTLMANARRPSSDGLRPKSNLLMVTSALANEGKTYTSTNLALSISMEPDTNVLLVDADSSKGSLSSLLGVPAGTPGLMDVLMEDGLGIEDVILKTDAPRFSIIPRGTPNEFATDLFSGNKMKQLLFELSVRYDNRIVMLDTSPLLMTTEARALANFIDQVPFVVGAEKTTQGSLEEALSYLSPDKYVGMILNMATRQSRAKYGYYNT